MTSEAQKGERTGTTTTRMAGTKEDTEKGKGKGERKDDATRAETSRKGKREESKELSVR